MSLCGEQSFRHASAAKQLEVNDVEEGVRKAAEAVRTEIAETKQLIENVSVMEANLDAKIERRKIELDRYEKRLQTLKKVRYVFAAVFYVGNNLLWMTYHLFIMQSSIPGGVHSFGKPTADPLWTIFGAYALLGASGMSCSRRSTTTSAARAAGHFGMTDSDAISSIGSRRFGTLNNG